MRRLDTPSLLLLSAFALAATRASAAEKAAPPAGGAPGSGSCVIVEYAVKSGDPASYTWYYCPSSRVFIRPDQRWITDFDTGIETRVLDKERKVRTLPISVKQEQRRADIERRSELSMTTTGKTEVIAGVTAEEYLFKVTYDGKPSEIHQWFAKDIPTPGRDKSAALDVDKEMAKTAPPGVLLRTDDREATSVRKGEPPAAALAIPADYEKQHWSTETKGWVDGQEPAKK